MLYKFLKIVWNKYIEWQICLCLCNKRIFSLCCAFVLKIVCIQFTVAHWKFHFAHTFCRQTNTRPPINKRLIIIYYILLHCLYKFHGLANVSWNLMVAWLHKNTTTATTDVQHIGPATFPVWLIFVRNKCIRAYVNEKNEVNEHKKWEMFIFYETAHGLRKPFNMQQIYVMWSEKDK